jgi:hypothetical protein
MTSKTQAAIEPRLIDMNGICIALSCSRPMAYRYVEGGDLDTIMQGRRRFATPKMIDECIERLRAKGSPKPSEAINNRWRKKPKGASAHLHG